MSAASVLVVAKVPVPGQAKTRLAATVGADVAAALAHAALLDTLAACEAGFGPGRRYVALAGDLGDLAAEPHRVLRRHLRHWVVLDQRGADLAERLEHAHADVHALQPGPVVQVGMDTPHLAPAALLRAAATAVGTPAHAPRAGGTVDGRPGTPVLGPATDGGWWLLASRTAHDVVGLRGVPMSTRHTGRATLTLLRRNAGKVSVVEVMCDVDDASDAETVARAAPHTGFARLWRRSALEHLREVGA